MGGYFGHQVSLQLCGGIWFLWEDAMYVFTRAGRLCVLLREGVRSLDRHFTERVQRGLKESGCLAALREYM
jgi:hypothetical protein